MNSLVQTELKGPHSYLVAVSGSEIGFLGPALFFSIYLVLNMPIELLAGDLEGATRGCNSSGEGFQAGLSRKHDKAKERACCENGGLF